MTRHRRLFALLAALLLLPGEVARAGTWCASVSVAGDAHGVASAHHAEAQEAPVAPAPDAHAAHGNHHVVAAEALTAAPHDAGVPAAPSHHGRTTACAFMAACANAAPTVPVSMTDLIVVPTVERANAPEPAALASRSDAPETPPPR